MHISPPAVWQTCRERPIIKIMHPQRMTTKALHSADSKSSSQTYRVPIWLLVQQVARKRRYSSRYTNMVALTDPSHFCRAIIVGRQLRISPCRQWIRKEQQLEWLVATRTKFKIMAISASVPESSQLYCANLVNSNRTLSPRTCTSNNNAPVKARAWIVLLVATTNLIMRCIAKEQPFQGQRRRKVPWWQGLCQG